MKLPRPSRPSGGDLVAGTGVALVVIPQSLAYAELAGLPAEIGLFASALPAILAAPFVSSRYLQTGPVAMTALLTFGALSPLAVPGTGTYVGLAALLAVMVGAIRVALGLVRLGRLAFLLSEPVLTGFTTGAAILIVSSQLRRLFDVPAGDGGVLVSGLTALARVDRWNWTAVVFALATAIAIVAGRAYHRRFPGVLLAVVAATALSGVIGYTGSTVGALSGDFVSLRFDLPWSSVSQLLVPATAIALIGFAEPSSIARTFAAEDREPWDPNREMTSQGVANLAAGFSGAFPVGGSFSRSSLNRLGGATSGWAGAVTGLVVLAALPLTPLLANLPTAVLGAIVVVAVVPLIRVDRIVTLIGQSAPQAAVAGGTMAATLLSAPRVERGVLVGIGLALGVHLLRELNVTVDGERRGDVLTVSPKGVLWFFTVPSVDRIVRAELAEHTQLDHVEIDLGGVGRLDYTGAAGLARIIADIRSSGVTVAVRNVPPGAAVAAGIHLTDD